jgi:hypothetical protein
MFSKVPAKKACPAAIFSLLAYKGLLLLYSITLATATPPVVL